MHQISGAMTTSEPKSDALGQTNFEITRRDFVKTSAITGCALMLPLPSLAQDSGSSSPAMGQPVLVPLSLKVNGETRDLTVDSRTSLLDLLREQLGLTGTKKGCDRGQCGACTVLVNRRRIKSCLSLAITHDGDSVTTIEGVGGGDKLHPVQIAFLDHDGFQCGYCTPGQICSAIALLNEWRHREGSVFNIAPDENARLSREEIRERMSGNLCRCGAYANIVVAVEDAYNREETA